MNRKIVLHLICVLNAIIGIAILISGAVAFLMRDPLFERLTLCGTGGVLAFLFAGIALLTRPKNEEDRKFSVRAGEWLLLRRGKKHGGLAPYPANLSFFWLHFMDDGTVISKLPQHGILREPANFSVHIQSFLNEQNRLEPDKKIMELLFLLMVQEMHRPSQDRLKVELATPLAIAAQKYIGTHFNEQLSLESIASELHCNPQYLSRLYRKVFGITLTEELNKRRIARAKWLLAYGSLSIKETASSSVSTGCTVAIKRDFFSIISPSPPSITIL